MRKADATEAGGSFVAKACHARRLIANCYNERMAAQRDVLIIGGGAIGLTTAYFLARDGVRVAVADKGEFGRESSWAGAGIIYPANLETATTPLNRLLGLSTSLYPTLSRELAEVSGIDNGFRICGGVELQSGIDKATVRTWRMEGIRFESLTGSELHSLEPAFAEGLEGGYLLPDMAQVRNPRHLQALRIACESLGVECLPHHAVREFRRSGSRVTAAATEKGEFSAGQFFVAAGAWSDGLLQPLGERIDVFPVRGQIVLFNPGRVLFARILSHGKCYLVPRADGRVLAGSTEEDAGFVKQTTPEGTETLTRFAIGLVPALHDAAIESAWAGLRPGTSRELPFLGRVPGFENLFAAAGHFRAGLMLSPGTGRVMSALLQGRAPPFPLDAFTHSTPT